jgi:Lysophospholipase L1 and related esterases
VKYLLLNIAVLFSYSLFAQSEQSKIDWPNLHAYKEQNAQLALVANNGNRVVFMGNSITQGWKEKDSAFFEEHKNYIDRGISGQTTPQMLLRFRQDVIDLKPAVVVILAGINDIAENTGHLSEEEIFANIQSMAELAKLHHIKVVLCSVLPAKTIPWRKYVEPIEKIIKLNNLIKEYCAKNNIFYVDYYSAMVDENKGLNTDWVLTGDTVHPNLAGYKKMEEIVQKTLKEIVK